MSDGIRKALEPKSEITIHSESGNSHTVRVENVIGCGGSCIAYKGYLYDSIGETKQERSVIIKELYPQALNIERKSDKSLVIDEKDKATFAVYKDHFCKGQTEHSKYYEMAMDTSLPRTFIYGESNNTYYAVSDPGVGFTLSAINRSKLNLYRIATIMISLCKALMPIHRNGHIYMDCKPDNIFLYSDNSLQDHVYLFDFNSIISADFVHHKEEYRTISSSPGWRAPELEGYNPEKRSDYEKISYAADIYSAGLVFLWLLTGKEPDLDVTSRTEWINKIFTGEFDWGSESDLCRNASQKAIDAISKILKKMLIKDQKERMDLLTTYTEPGRPPRAVYFYMLIHDFQELYSLTFGNDPYYGSVYETIERSQEKFLEQSLDAQKSINDHISASEKVITEQIKKSSLKSFLFGSKKRTVVTVLVLVIAAVSFGALSQLGSNLTQKVAASPAAKITADFDDHILLDLANANHQYEVGLENWRRLDYNRAERDITSAREEISKDIAESDTEVAKINNSLGCLYVDMGRYEDAYDYLNSAYVVFRDKYGDESVEARAVLFSIAQYDFYTGDFDNAMQTAQRIIDCSDVSKDSVILTTVNHFKAMILDARGEYQEALSVYQEVLNLYSAYLEDGKLTKEFTDYTKDKSLNSSKRESYTNTVQWIALTYNNIGQTFLHMGEKEEAISYLQTGLEMCLDNIYIGKRNLLTAKLYMNLAKAQVDKNIKEALENIDLAMRIERNLFDFEDVYPGLVEVYYTYADLLYLNGDVKDAKNYYNDSIELALNSFGQNHLLTATAYFARGQYALQENLYDDAESDFTNAIEIRKNMLCLKHPETVDYYIGLAYSHIGEKKKSKAVEDLNEARNICDALSLSDDYYDKINIVQELCM
ncbi:MAG: tetratricopeptide repeat protein [Butyrivibrio sp.]|nr:tetratricopeptide repeat protein [Butyrivibrio sp.]